MTTSMTIAVDLAKTVFEIAVANGHGTIIERHRSSRSQFKRFFHNPDTPTVVMEACGTAPFLSRELTRLGCTNTTCHIRDRAQAQRSWQMRSAPHRKRPVTKPASLKPLAAIRPRCAESMKAGSLKIHEQTGSSTATQYSPFQWRSRWTCRLFTPVGRMALTNYLLQSAVYVPLFYGFGQIMFSHLWLALFHQGPMESLWRMMIARGPGTRT